MNNSKTMVITFSEGDREADHKIMMITAFLNGECDLFPADDIFFGQDDMPLPY